MTKQVDNWSKTLRIADSGAIPLSSIVCPNNLSPKPEFIDYLKISIRAYLNHSDDYSNRGEAVQKQLG